MKILFSEMYVLLLAMIVGILRMMRLLTDKMHYNCSSVVQIVVAIIACDYCIVTPRGGCSFSNAQPHRDLDMHFRKLFGNNTLTPKSNYCLRRMICS